jgi:hypothetical protein
MATRAAGGSRWTIDRAHRYAHAAARIAIGGEIALAPTRWIGRQWFGKSADDGATRIAMRGMGTRELILGLAIARELTRGRSAGPLFAMCMVAELIDATGSLLGPESFRRAPAVGVPALSLTAAASGAYLAWRADD